MKKLNAQELKKFATNEENVKLMQTLFEAIAFSETITAIVEKKSSEILNFYKFVAPEIRIQSKDGMRFIPSEVILKTNSIYKLKDEDLELYLKKMNEFYQSEECPVKPTKEGNCPALEREAFVRNLKIEIAEFFAPTLGINYDDISGSLKFYKEYYDLIMKMFAPQIKAI